MATTSNAFVRFLRHGSALGKLVAVNLLVFVILRLLVAVFMLSGHDDWQPVLTGLLRLPGSLWQLMWQPWTVVTYMFTQYSVLQLLFNMLWLYWFGMVFVSVASQCRLVALYLYGGLAGAVLYIVCCMLSLWPGIATGGLMGSSAAVIAVVVATAVMAPEFRMNLLFFGEVPLKWIAVVMIAIDIIGISAGNVGGHLAHIGGAVMGCAYGVFYRRGIDLAAPVCRLGRLRFRRSSRRHPADIAGHSTTSERQLDDILDKVRRSGYASLSADERAALFDISNKLRRK